MSSNNEESFPATVTSNDDPEQRGRIKVSCVGILADEDGEVPMWIEPSLDWGWFVVPDVGEQVEVVMNTSHELDEVFGQASIDAPNVRWRGGRFWTSADAEEPREIPEDFKTNYGKRRGFATPSGHIFMFDDTDGKEKITLTWTGKRDGAQGFSFYSVDEDGSLVMSNRNGSLIYLNAADGEIAIVDEHGNSISTADTGIKLVDLHGNIIELKDGDISIVSSGNIIATGADFTSATGSVNLIDGADNHIVRGEDLITWLNAHTHPTGMGPSGPPSVPAIPTDFLSLEGMIL